MIRPGKHRAQRTFIDVFCIYIFICHLFNNAVSAFDYSVDIRNSVTMELNTTYHRREIRGGAVGCGTVLQAGRSRVQFPTESMT